MDKKPEIVVFAGPNGSGKSTSHDAFLKKQKGGITLNHVLVGKKRKSVL